MCGIFGAYIPSGADSARSQLQEALNCMAHRGPDSSGTWLSEDNRLFLGHRRLAIIDLSPTGHQPMSSPSGRYTISFNGEIYNFQELRKELESVSQKLSSGGDTAVMLASFEAWGITKALSKFVGMFAFAVWDEKNHELTLARDRAGEKPLYYTWKDGRFIFASEISAILKSAMQPFKISSTSLGHLLKFGYIPAPLSIFEHVFKLSAASSLTLNKEVLPQQPSSFSPYHGAPGLAPQKYWELKNYLNIGNVKGKSESQYLEELEFLLRQSIKQQMIADVPLGAFLSGGIDSTTIVALMQSVAKNPVRTFSIGFEQKSHDEAPYAKAIANYLGTDHTEMYVSEQDALNVIPKLPEIYSEPFADSSQIPTFLVSKLTRQNVTVSLSGDGGDEMFGGYQRFLWTKKLWNLSKWTPEFLSKELGRVANFLPTRNIDQLVVIANRFLPVNIRLKNAAAKIQRALSMGAAPSPQDLYLVFLSQKCDPAKLVQNFKASKTYLDSVQNWPKTNDIYSSLMWMDFETYLPDDIFVKVDRASMAVALEARAPFLDHRLVEFAYRLPSSMKIRGSTTKYLLRKLLSKYVPNQLTNRPKMGFGIPVAKWLSGELKPWAEDLLSQENLEQCGLLNVHSIRDTWKSHLNGNHSNQYLLWHTLMFQDWFKKHRIYIADY